MKKLGFILMACALIMGLAQCKKNDETSKPENSADSVFITLNVGGGTRANVVPEDDIAPVYYAEGDMIHVVSDGKYIGTLTCNGSNFGGDITNPTEGQPLHFYFLGNVTPNESLVVGETTTCSVVISDQTTNHPVISYAPSTVNYSVGTTNYTATLLNKCALVKFNVVTSSETATCVTGFNNMVTVNFTTTSFAYSKTNSGIITLPGGSGEKWAILLPQEAMEAGAVGSAYSLDGVYSGTYEAVPAISNNSYLNEGIDVVVSKKYVDLGLPSGLLWATCNVGASIPENRGSYYAWGEIQGKLFYQWSNYVYCRGSGNTLTKYCTSSNYGYNGYTDNLTTLLPEDDVATVILGNGWRIPTIAEWQELLNETSNYWVKQNGVNGRLIIASNGNRLFLPAAGVKLDGNFNGVGDSGYNWSSSLSGSSPCDALMLYYYYGWGQGYNCLNQNRKDGLPVRAVRSAPQN